MMESAPRAASKPLVIVQWILPATIQAVMVHPYLYINQRCSAVPEAVLSWAALSASAGRHENILVR
jgi:hypothetical protein